MTIVFEKAFEQSAERDTLFMRLECSADNEVEYPHVQSITINEELGLGCPTLVVDFMDGSGDFVNNNRLDTEAIYTFHLGRNMEEAVATPYKIVDVSNGNAIQGRSKNMKFKIFFAHAKWETLSAIKKCKAWNLKKHHEVITDIIEPIGFAAYEIEPSLKVIDNFTQTQTTDIDYIKKLTKSAIPAAEDGHYVFCGRWDNVFFCVSTMNLITKGMIEKSKDVMPLLTLGGQPPKKDRSKMYAENTNVPVGFTGFGAKESYGQNAADGVTTTESSYYDWNSRRYVRKSFSTTDIMATQLSEWTFARAGATYKSKKIFGGRNPMTLDIAHNRLASQLWDMQEIYVNIEGHLTIHAGKIVELLITTSEDCVDKLNEMMSGFYMVKRVRHMMTTNKLTDFVTQLTLTRSGMDSKKLKGYLKTAKGSV